jgi:hypothetical protein
MPTKRQKTLGVTHLPPGILSIIINFAFYPTVVSRGRLVHMEKWRLINCFRYKLQYTPISLDFMFKSLYEHEILVLRVTNECKFWNSSNSMFYEPASFHDERSLHYEDLQKHRNWASHQFPTNLVSDSEDEDEPEVIDLSKKHY